MEEESIDPNVDMVATKKLWDQQWMKFIKRKKYRMMTDAMIAEHFRVSRMRKTATKEEFLEASDALKKSSDDLRARLKKDFAIAYPRTYVIKTQKAPTDPA